MDDAIRRLIDVLRRQTTPDRRQIGNLRILLTRNGGVAVDFLISLIDDPCSAIREAAVMACHRRTEPQLLTAIAARISDPAWEVRKALAFALKNLPINFATPLLLTLLADADADVRYAAVISTQGHPVFQERLRALFRHDDDWHVRMAAANLLVDQQDFAIIVNIVDAIRHDADDDVRAQCVRVLDRCAGMLKNKLLAYLPTDPAIMYQFARRIEHVLLNHSVEITHLQKLENLMITPPEQLVETQELERFGTDLTALARAGMLPRAYGYDRHCQALVQLLQSEHPRSIALLGESGVGKSALVNELVYELMKPEHGGWHVLRMSPADIMSGTKYTGEWETKVNELVATVRRPRRVLVYVPSLAELSTAGTWSKSDYNVAAALAPHLEDGSVVLLGESTPEEFERGLGGIASLQRVFERYLLPEAGPDETRAILRALRDAGNTALDDAVLDRLFDLAQQYFGFSACPGNAVALLRTVFEAQKSTDAPITLRHILEALSRSSGIPVDLLDDDCPFRPQEARRYFEERIIGQPDAIDAVLDVITLIKGGLTDPQKPLGVFLFIGPTGVGKTELARNLAEYIFGDAARLLRYDMSEYASPQSFERLIGSNTENGLLTDAVRQHPFSVVLLDEIEKSNVFIFDLCLQLFDAGRLTDGRGRTVDFRNTIVILTSNVGATAPTPPLGFGEERRDDVEPASRDRVFRELTRVFRPEFLNRIDRIVHFHPLSIEVATRIAERELTLVLRRSGITRRQLRVEVDPAVLALMVREGYSPHFGARPLKRTVEQMLLLPLARAITSGRVPSHSLLRVTPSGSRVEVTVVRPTAGPAPEPVVAPAPSLRETLALLGEQWQALAGQTEMMAQRKSLLLESTYDSAFYADRAACAATFDEIHRLDQFLAFADELRVATEGVQRRLLGAPLSLSEHATVRERVDRLLLQAMQLRRIATCRDAVDLGDAVLCLTRLDSHGDPLNGVELLCEMYQGFAARWRLSATPLAEYYTDDADRLYLQVTGLGACALLRGEAGLHQLSRKVSRRGTELAQDQRELIRVDVLPLSSDGQHDYIATLKPTVHPLKPPRTRLVHHADLAIHLFDPASLRTLEAWTTGPRAEAIDRLGRILSAQVTQPAADPEAAATIIRGYELGKSPKIRDLRSGQTTTRIKAVLQGSLDELLPNLPL